MLKLVIDADPIVYRVGFASETRQYGAVAKDALGNLFDGFFTPTDKKSASDNLRNWLESNDLELVDRWPVVIPAPVDHTLHSVRKQVDSIRAAAAKYLDVYDVDTTVVLTGPGNYRCQLAKQKPYKGNRDPEHKPVHYQLIRDYLVNALGARVVHGREADDEVSILARRQPSIVATIDKDLDQVPGLHYDYAKKVFYTVSEEDAERFFWIQTLAGDGTDNIPGCPGLGLKKAAKIIDMVYEAKPVSGTTLGALLWEQVVAEYDRKNLSEDVALETARLVYMQREPNELWTPPGEAKQYMTGEVE